ncbi:MAG: hypothetical protein ACKOXB_12720 [Flavobacteriales bacterium]
MIKAVLKEKYIVSTDRIKRQGVEEIIHETRYFTSMNEFHKWYDKFKAKLWEDDHSKVDLVEGIYVEVEELKADDLSVPKALSKYASFREGVSYYYAA